jgi:aminobenzoyl-glutamate utilization protein B
MMHAAKIMAVTAADLYTDPGHLRKARAEFDEAVASQPSIPPRPSHIVPPQYENPVR